MVIIQFKKLSFHEKEETHTIFYARNYKELVDRINSREDPLFPMVVAVDYDTAINNLRNFIWETIKDYSFKPKIEDFSFCIVTAEPDKSGFFKFGKTETEFMLKNEIK